MKLKLIKLESVNSTNDEAIKLIKNNKNRPSIITAKIQKKGKGTMGKKWISQMGNIFVSIFFEIRNDKIPFQQFSIFKKYSSWAHWSPSEKRPLLTHSTTRFKRQSTCISTRNTLFHCEKHFLVNT